jgi:Family of unknown function (DUF6886)
VIPGDRAHGVREVPLSTRFRVQFILVAATQRGLAQPCPERGVVRYVIVTALWHVSDLPAIVRFEPRAVATHDSPEPLVWAIDDEHVPAYWFPRDCPRGTFWAVESTTDADVDRFLGDRGTRVHAIEHAWLDDMQRAKLTGYRLPAETFEPYVRAAGHWVSREPVEPLGTVPLDDLVQRHADAGIELRLVPDLAALWQRVIASSLEFSGIRLRNLSLRRPDPRT